MARGPAAEGQPPVRTLIDELLAEQRTLSAVEIFARGAGVARGRTAHRYEALLPASAPRPGWQYAFEVDLDLCSGCKACVTACHAMNGLEDDESWRTVGLLISAGPGSGRPTYQHVTTACHHCVEPGCLEGCPVLAYDKDPITGIVRHLDDQCMGCSYCVMKCPYEVPQYSDRLGIVRKCDLCRNRLAVGEAPACVQSCPNEAIRITLVDQEMVRGQFQRSVTPPEESSRDKRAPAANEFLPDSPDPALTKPTTRFKSERGVRGSVAADAEHLRLDHGHEPLVAMLVLTQASAGLAVASAVAGLAGGTGHFTVWNTAAFGLLVAGLAASVFHLGRPLKAWRAFLGWRKSWLSREIIAFQLAAVLAVAAAATAWSEAATAVTVAVTASYGLVGLGAVGASSMVYADTGRPFWGVGRVWPSFFGTAGLLGSALASVGLHWGLSGKEEADPAPVWWGILLTAILAVGLAEWRRRALRDARDDAAHPAHWNARVVEELLPAAGRWQAIWTWGAIGVAGAAVMARGPWLAVATVLMASLLLVGEWHARRLFFLAGGARRMPGGCPG